MPEIAPQHQATILQAVRQLHADVRALRDSTEVKNGYLGFEYTEATLGNLHAAIAGSRDRDQIVLWLKGAQTQIALTGGGDVGPAADSARKALKDMQEVLESPPVGRVAPMSDDDLLSRLRAELEDTTEQSPKVAKLLREALDEIVRLRAQTSPVAGANADTGTADTARMPALPLPSPAAAIAPDDGTELTPGRRDGPKLPPRR